VRERCGKERKGRLEDWNKGWHPEYIQAVIPTAQKHTFIRPILQAAWFALGSNRSQASNMSLISRPCRLRVQDTNKTTNKNKKCVSCAVYGHTSAG
jgi:hypothetical protein